MAYATSNPPSCITQRVGATGGAMWIYNSADAATVVRVDGYITDADDLGMKVGDIVTQVDMTAAAVGHMYLVNAINANGSADLSDGTAIVATNTD